MKERFVSHSKPYRNVCLKTKFLNYFKYQLTISNTVKLDYNELGNNQLTVITNTIGYNERNITAKMTIYYTN